MTATSSTKHSLHRLFEHRVQTTPKTIAVVHNQNTITYEELNNRANQLARSLIHGYETHHQRAFVSETPVILVIERSIDTIVSIIAILKAGGAFVPIDPKAPSAKLMQIYQDIQCSVLVYNTSTITYTETFLSGNFPITFDGQQRESPYTLNTDELLATETCSENLRYEALPTQLAYITYTSGTTGKSKGVMIEHQSVQNLVTFFKETLGLDTSTKLAQLSALSFDASISEIFPALLSSSTLVIIDDNIKRDPVLLVEALQKHKITVATILPSWLTQITRVYNGTPNIPYLSTLIVAGEACSREVMSVWSKHRTLINGYGPTETTVCAMMHVFSEDDKPTCLGRPITNTKVYVVSDEGQLVGPGCSGELYISGLGLARGYWNTLERTAKSFIKNPFIDTSNSDQEIYGRIYKTGDWVQINDERQIEFIGRRDGQVKIRGHRVELGEIQNALLQLKNIVQTHVMVSENPSISEKNFLVAYYSSNTPYDNLHLRIELKEYLPTYMIPDHFIWVKNFPLTSHGKVDTAQLHQLPKNSPVPCTQWSWTNAQKALFKIWQEILGHSQITLDSSFFDIGGNSMLVIALVEHIKQRLRIRTSVSKLYEYDTIRKQVKLMDRSNTEGFKQIQKLKDGKWTPLFFIHPSMTGHQVYRKMVSWLSPEQAFYGIDSYNINHLDALETDLHALAHRYLDEIMHVQRTGPYLLGGYSAGGNIAFEVASILAERGEEVRKIYLIDTVLPSPGPEIGHKETVDFLSYFDLGDADDKGLLRLARAEMNLLFSHRPQFRLKTKIVLFKATKALSPLESLPTEHIARRLFDNSCKFGGWTSYAEEVDLYYVESNHETIMTPEYLKPLTRIIQADAHPIDFGGMQYMWS